ncbi:MAG TPA: tetratricopeptide repeat protein [Alkalispirochaeta sp.]|nr:tetratricopeptide repeat protein [Alkalispirochaeta sp.]
MPFPVVAALLAVTIVILTSGYLLIVGKRNASPKQSAKKKDRNTILREANKRLASNPRDHNALRTIADLYYDEETWDKAMKTYGILMNLAASNSEVEEWEATARYGLSALKLKNYDEAYKSLMMARTMKEDSFEINHNLGYLEYRRGNLEKAAQLLRHAEEAQPEDLATKRYLGRALHKLQHYRDAVRQLKQVVDAEPEDKESLFFLAQSYQELGQNEQALTLYTHLRPDPTMGPHAALFAGTIRMGKREVEKATEDFELGLRHEKIREDVTLELRYRLAAAYMKLQEIGKALSQLAEIHRVNPGYKDVASQISRNKELHSNHHLKTYLISPSAEFVTLCRRMVMTFYKNAKVKVVDVQVQKNEYTDILTEVETAKWEDIILFRFIRGTGQVGELVVRELNSRLKETRAGRGFCITAGSFSESAEHFVEARLIDLLDKEELLKIFARLD